MALVVLFLMLATKLVYSQDFGFTSFTYDTFDPNSPDNYLYYEGGAHVPPGSGFLRLTQTDSNGLPVSWNYGRVIYINSVVFWEDSPAPRQANFETTIRFIITPSAQGAADGIAFYIAAYNTLVNETSSGANLGIFKGPTGTAPSVFAIEFDTFVNGGWDPNYRHIGVDIESRVSKSTTEFDSATGQVVTACINYDATTKTISVVATSGSQTASLTYVFDLKTILPQEVEVGVSASTGQTVSQLGVFDLISWNFTSSLVSTNDDTYIRQYV